MLMVAPEVQGFDLCKDVIEFRVMVAREMGRSVPQPRVAVLT